MNGYAFQDLVIKQARAERRAAAEAVTAGERERSDRDARARQLIGTRMPDLLDEHGRPCSYAVWALLRLWAAFGEGNVTPAAVRAERGLLMPGEEVAA